MREADARWLYLVRAIEREDTDHILLTAEDRAQADMAARGDMGDPKAKKAGQAYLVSRSRFAGSRLATRHPVIAKALKAAQWPRWLSTGLPAIALVLGVLTNELGNGGQLNLLAFPLIGVLVWNIAVYIAIAVNAVARRSRGGAGGIGQRIWRKLSGMGGLDRGGVTPLARGLSRFASAWTKASAGLMGLRSAQTFHLSAATFALGLIGGIFLRALAIEYRAGWESTFLTPDVVHTLLSAILGPASALTGISIPDAAGIAALRWQADGSGGVNAKDWIILYTATAMGVIVIPRLILAAWASVRASVAARRIPVPGREDFYVRKLLRSVTTGSYTARITSYAYRPDEDAKERLTALVQEALGDGAGIHFDNPVNYGAEDDWRESASPRETDACHIALFTLSATPENENHGQFVRQLRDLAQAGTAVAAMVDESAYRAHFAGQSGLDSRIESRSAAWRDILAQADVVPLFVDLSNADPLLERERLESILVDGGSLEVTHHAS